MNKIPPIYPAYCDSEKKREQFRQLMKNKKKNKNIIDKSHPMRGFHEMLKDKMKENYE